jgi:hypothetical protein
MSNRTIAKDIVLFQERWFYSRNQENFIDKLTLFHEQIEWNIDNKTFYHGFCNPLALHNHQTYLENPKNIKNIPWFLEKV